MPVSKENKNKPILNIYGNKVCNFNIKEYLLNSPTRKYVVKCGLLNKIINSSMKQNSEKNISLKKSIEKQKFKDKMETDSFIRKLSRHKN